MATVADDFTTEVQTNLPLHAPTGPNAGTGWTEEERTGVEIAFVATGDDLRSAGENDDRHLYSIQPNPSVAEYDVQSSIPRVTDTTSRPFFLLARLTDASNYYSAGSYIGTHAADKKIFKKVAGTVTELASGDNGTVNGDVLKFEVRDVAKKLFQNGGEVLSTSDNVLTTAGRAGVGQGNAWVATDNISSTWNIDDFSYVEVAGGGAFPFKSRGPMQAMLAR